MKPISGYGYHLFARLSRSVARTCYSLLFHLFPIVMLVIYISCNSLYERAKVWGRRALLVPRTSRDALKKLWPLFVIIVVEYERVSQHIREAIWSRYERERHLR